MSLFNIYGCDDGWNLTEEEFVMYSRAEDYPWLYSDPDFAEKMKYFPEQFVWDKWIKVKSNKTGDERDKEEEEFEKQPPYLKFTEEHKKYIHELMAEENFLTTNERAAVWLRFWQNYGVAEIADALSIRTDYAGRLLDRALLKFKNRLKAKSNEIKKMKKTA